MIFGEVSPRYKRAALTTKRCRMFMSTLNADKPLLALKAERLVVTWHIGLILKIEHQMNVR